MIEITAMEQNEEKTKRNEDSLINFWDNIKYTNTPFLGSRRRRERKGLRIYEQSIAEKSPNMRK